MRCLLITEKSAFKTVAAGRQRFWQDISLCFSATEHDSISRYGPASPPRVINSTVARDFFSGQTRFFLNASRVDRKNRRKTTNTMAGPTIARPPTSQAKDSATIEAKKMLRVLIAGIFYAKDMPGAIPWETDLNPRLQD